MLGALLGPNIASLTKDIISTSTYTGSYLFYLLTICNFLFIFYTNEKPNNEYIDKKLQEIIILLQPKFTQAVVEAAIGCATMSFLMTATPISIHIDGMSINKTGCHSSAYFIYVFTFFIYCLIN